MTLGKSLLPSGTMQRASLPPPGSVYGIKTLCYRDDQVTWKTFHFKRLPTTEDTRVGDPKQENPGSRREDPRPAPRLSRDLLPELLGVSLSAAVAATAEARKRLTGAARIPPPPAQPGPPSLGPPIPAPPDLPLGLGPPRARAAPPRRRRPPVHPRVPRSTCSRLSLRLPDREAPAEPEAWALSPRRRDSRRPRRRR